MTDLTPTETLAAFVLRARRVAAHSLAQGRETLAGFADGSFSGHLDTTGRLTITRRLPADEEAFESLAARLRPLTLAREPIHYLKVCDALETIVTDAYSDRLARLRASWVASEIQGSHVQGLTLQQSKLDGSEATGQVSDTQLAAGWLYGDLVHADPTGPKKAAMDFPLTERYAAAVRVFSRHAQLTLATLELVEELVAAELVTIPAAAFDDDVVVGTDELLFEAQGYMAPEGTEAPDLRTSTAWPKEWVPFTITELRRQDPTNQVRVRLRGIDHDIAVYDSAVVHRDMSVEPGLWHILVGGSLVFKFGIHFEDGRFVGGEFHGVNEMTGSNELRLASGRLRLQLHQATSVSVGTPDVDFFELGGFELEPRTVREIEVVTEVLDDIVTIERLVGERFGLCESRFDNRHRVLLRRMRLLHEGKLVRADAGPYKVTVHGAGPPSVVSAPASSLDVGGATVPMLAAMFWHPEMISTLVESDGDTSTYTVTVPNGERFFSWAPGKRDMSPASDFTDVSPYDLSDLDETTVGI